jgi:TRAP-type C4-dicarboxylate transport system permease small subunit
MAALTLVVLAGVAFRKAGAALVWYDEVASILLAWLTFYGAALAALHRGHIGFPRVTQMLPERPRRIAFVLVEVIVIGFFLLVAWGGWQVFVILGGDVLVSLPSVPRRVAQSAIPIAAILYVIAELIALATPREADDDDDAYPDPGSAIRGEAGAA